MGPPRGMFDWWNCNLTVKLKTFSSCKNFQQFESAQIHTGMCMMQSSREQKSSGCQLGRGFVFQIEPSLVLPAHLWEKLKNWRTSWATEAWSATLFEWSWLHMRNKKLQNCHIYWPMGLSNIGMRGFMLDCAKGNCWIMYSIYSVINYFNLAILWYHLPTPARWLWMGAVGLHHRSVSAAAGASLCGRVSGVSLLQSHCWENTRLAHITLAPCAGSTH